MDPITIVTIATAALKGVEEAIAAWPTVQEVVLNGIVPTVDQQTQIDAAFDASRAALAAAIQGAGA